MDRNLLRKEKIAARNSLLPQERELQSAKIVERIIASPEFQRAKTIMIYRGVRGEVRLDRLEGYVRDLLIEQSMPVEKEQSIAISTVCASSNGGNNDKRICYPLCISNTAMIALAPQHAEAWRPGAFGIPEPIRKQSTEIAPEDIDLVICPCTVFDEQGGRMGMGGGFYDRFLSRCTKAVIAAVAFECQKTEAVPMEAWDQRMDVVFTEEKRY